jgi:hypothetical protein
VIRLPVGLPFCGFTQPHLAFLLFFILGLPLQSPDGSMESADGNSLLSAALSHFDPGIIRRFINITAPDD